MNRIVLVTRGFSGVFVLSALFLLPWPRASANPAGSSGMGEKVAPAASISGVVAPQGARETAALADIATMRDAEALVQADTGYYTSLENLNDIPGTELIVPRDGIDDQGGAWMLDPGTGRWYPSRLLLDRAPQQWQGPYVSYQNTAGDDGAGYDPGTPLDPWGNPYLVFSPLGLARPTIPDITLEYYGDQFDRWYIISLGADGVMSSDDLGMAFGSSPTAQVISSVRVLSSSSGSTAAARGSTQSATVQPTTVTWFASVKGYNFGTSQGVSSILLDGTAVGDAATSWTSNLILQPLPPNFVPGTHSLAVKTGAVVSNPFSFVFTGSRTAVKGRVWDLYK